MEISPIEQGKTRSFILKWYTTDTFVRTGISKENNLVNALNYSSESVTIPMGSEFKDDMVPKLKSLPLLFDLIEEDRVLTILKVCSQKSTLFEFRNNFISEILLNLEENKELNLIHSEKKEKIILHIKKKIEEMFELDFIANSSKNVLVLDSVSRLPIRHEIKPANTKTIVLIYFAKENHYEIFGRLLPENKIQREFENNDPLLQNK
jgi:hypothetical protein